MGERLCPFCRFPLKPGSEAHTCHECGAEHHGECWADNGGCAIMGCAAAPDGTSSPAPRPAPAPEAAPPPPPPPAAPAASSSSRGLAAAIIVLALAVAGVAIAVVVTRPGDPVAPDSAAASAETAAPTSTPETTATSTPEPTETPTAEPTETPTPEPTEAPDPREEIEDVLTRYYAHVVNDDFDAAWKLLSPSYKRWKASNGGYSKWVTQEEFHRDRLDPSGLRVELRSIDGNIATIDVTGMHYRADWDPDCDFEGVTWFRRAGGRWRYDQGYLQSAARSAEWRPKRRQTLGFTCEVDGY